MPWLFAARGAVRAERARDYEGAGAPPVDAATRRDSLCRRRDPCDHTARIAEELAAEEEPT